MTCKGLVRGEVGEDVAEVEDDDHSVAKAVRISICRHPRYPQFSPRVTRYLNVPTKFFQEFSTKNSISNPRSRICGSFVPLGKGTFSVWRGAVEGRYYLFP